MQIPVPVAAGFLRRYAAPNAVFPAMKILSKTAVPPAVIQPSRRTLYVPPKRKSRQANFPSGYMFFPFAHF